MVLITPLAWMTSVASFPLAFWEERRGGELESEKEYEEQL